MPQANITLRFWNNSKSPRGEDWRQHHDFNWAGPSPKQWNWPGLGLTWLQHGNNLNHSLDFFMWSFLTYRWHKQTPQTTDEIKQQVESHMAKSNSQFPESWFCRIFFFFFLKHYYKITGPILFKTCWKLFCIEENSEFLWQKLCFNCLYFVYQYLILTDCLFFFYYGDH